MDAKCHGLGNAQRAIHAAARTMVVKDDDARFVQEQPSNEIVTHIPECRELVDREMTLECGGRRASSEPKRDAR